MTQVVDDARSGRGHPATAHVLQKDHTQLYGFASSSLQFYVLSINYLILHKYSLLSAQSRVF